MTAGQSLTGASTGSVDALSVLEDLLSASVDPVILLDSNETLKAFNRSAERVFGLTGMQGQPVATHAALASALAVESAGAHAHPIWDAPDGRSFAVHRSHVPSGGFLITLRDVTDWRHVSIKLADLMHIASHDLRSPLTALKSYAEMLVDEYFGEMSHEQQAALNKLTLGIYGMVSLVDNLQAADRFDPQQGPYKTDRNPLDLSQLMRELIAKQDLPADIQKITLDLVVAPDVPIIRADSLMLECAIANLLDNAMKFSPAGSTVLMRVTTQGAAVLISVQDQGRGIAPEDYIRIFERSVRIEPPGEKRVRGSGLGLFVVRSVAERHGGSVWVESTLGKGSTFFLKLPVRGEATGA